MAMVASRNKSQNQSLPSQQSWNCRLRPTDEPLASQSSAKRRDDLSCAANVELMVTRKWKQNCPEEERVNVRVLAKK